MPTLTPGSVATGSSRVPAAIGLMRFVFPELADPAPAAEPLPAPVGVPGALATAEPAFDEAELARAMAWADHSARQAVAAATEAGLRSATERLAAELAGLRAARQELAELAAHQALALFGCLARSCLEQLCGRAPAEAMARAAVQVLAELPAGQAAIVTVAPELAEPLAALLDGQDGLACTWQVRGQAGMEPGDVALCWPSGWSEWSFEQLRQQFLAALDSMPAATGDAPTPALPDPKPAAALQE